MTWSVFIQTMRQGVTNRASVATRRANPQRSGASTTRNNSIQTPTVNKTDAAKEVIGLAGLLQVHGPSFRVCN